MQQAGLELGLQDRELLAQRRLAHAEAGGRTGDAARPAYRFVSWTRGDSLKLERFADYAGPSKPTIRHATIRFINDENAQISALQAGDVDYVPVVATIESVDGFKDDKRFKLDTGMTQGGMLWLYDFPKVGVSRKELAGLWKNAPVPAYPIAEMRWQAGK
ncbi:ABC transporter substrate-binding protein [Vineibacter terrae]|uniref:ABC transporter substrate-binding protein n=1 Tax=Vineibacter terrae TaxID=2586908 RepID=UPI0039C8D7C7